MLCDIVSFSMMLIWNALSDKLALSDFNRSNLRKGYKVNADITLVRGLDFQVGYQDRLHVNSDVDEALA